MTTFAPLQDRDELDAAVRTAWREYSDGLRGLEPHDYDEQEPVAWDQLQARLRELDGAREQVSGA
jgi:hypothetical protein